MTHTQNAPGGAHVRAVVVGRRERAHEQRRRRRCAWMRACVASERQLPPERIQKRDGRGVGDHVGQERLRSAAQRTRSLVNVFTPRNNRVAHRICVSTRTCASHSGSRGMVACSGVSRLPTSAAHASAAARVAGERKRVHVSRTHMQSPTSPSRTEGASQAPLSLPEAWRRSDGDGGADSARSAAECAAKCAATCRCAEHRAASAHAARV
jgi:hypothetical protein